MLFPTLGLKKKGKRVLMKIIKIMSNSHKFLQLKTSVWIDQDTGSKWVLPTSPHHVTKLHLKHIRRAFPSQSTASTFSAHGLSLSLLTIQTNDLLVTFEIASHQSLS